MEGSEKKGQCSKHFSDDDSETDYPMDRGELFWVHSPEPHEKSTYSPLNPVPTSCENTPNRATADEEETYSVTPSKVKCGSSIVVAPTHEADTTANLPSFSDNPSAIVADTAPVSPDFSLLTSEALSGNNTDIVLSEVIPENRSGTSTVRFSPEISLETSEPLSGTNIDTVLCEVIPEASGLLSSATIDTVASEVLETSEPLSGSDTTSCIHPSKERENTCQNVSQVNTSCFTAQPKNSTFTPTAIVIDSSATNSKKSQRDVFTVDVRSDSLHQRSESLDYRRSHSNREHSELFYSSDTCEASVLRQCSEDEAIATRSSVASGPLSRQIKAAVADTRNKHYLRVPSREEDSHRLYQSDSYLPALRLRSDGARSDLSYHGQAARNTVPRVPSTKNRPAVAKTFSLKIPRDATDFSSGRLQDISLVPNYNSSGDHTKTATSPSRNILKNPALQNFSEGKLSPTSPPMSPLTKGLQCSSLSYFLPPPSISSINKQWRRCYDSNDDSPYATDDASDVSGSHAGSCGSSSGCWKRGGDRGARYDLAAKVILLGDFSVGKTSFLNTLSRARDEVGSGFCKEFRPGELAEVIFKRQEKRAMIRVMDTGGQERYRSMTSSYYRGVHGCLLVFDVTREDTFNNIMIWHSDLTKYASDQYVAAILVGTTSHPGNRVISPERGMKMAESLGIPYMECSPDDEKMTLAVVQRLTENVIKYALRRTSFAIDLKPQMIVRLEDKKKKTFVCLC